MVMISRALPRREGGQAATHAGFRAIALAAVLAAAALFLLSQLGGAGFDRLLPEGQPFLPYFTT